MKKKWLLLIGVLLLFSLTFANKTPGHGFCKSNKTPGHGFCKSNKTPGHGIILKQF